MEGNEGAVCLCVAAMMSHIIRRRRLALSVHAHKTPDVKRHHEQQSYNFSLCA